MQCRKGMAYCNKHGNRKMHGTLQPTWHQKENAWHIATNVTSEGECKPFATSSLKLKENTTTCRSSCMQPTQ